MGNLTVSNITSSEGGGGSPSISCPMLNTVNYTVWAMKMRIALRVHKVWEVIEPESATDTINIDKNNMAIALLVQSIPESLTLQVGELDSAKKMWEAIKARHVGAERVKEARLQTLMAEFDRLRMKDTEKVDDFVGRLSEVSAKMAALGENLKESRMVKKFLKCLPRAKFIHMVASLEQVLDLNTTSFVDIVGRLKAYEERISEEEEIQEDHTKLLYATWRDNLTIQTVIIMENIETEDEVEDFLTEVEVVGVLAEEEALAEVETYRLLKLQETHEDGKSKTQEADELMMHEIVFLNEERCIPSKFETNKREENVWYLDNGASNHMTRDRRYFDSIDTSITGKVRFGDDSRIDIKGKGSIAFTDMYGEPEL
ncbi:PREDICTED: uncharacterized protein LOC109130457 [Camelina sativa]|uniref:Uncharacterized protein LOC109130457 n=1 Tax=Camelina sativa TaxID=90675 RepID=A0ABM1R980_CAMSA|nr:PREDICTED: uncharacterized protein LOC109130457 [Camelina sativa]